MLDDCCRIVKGKRLEQISLTLMNEAFHIAKQAASTRKVVTPSFSVQSEKEIWWLGAFKVPKETHEVLSWVFQRIPFIIKVIKSQSAGEQLTIEGCC